jgi:uncharacterized Zn finger protein (UPF0148 family)
METRECPLCGRNIYGREGNFRCPYHGFFKENYRTGELEGEYDEAEKEENC